MKIWMQISAALMILLMVVFGYAISLEFKEDLFSKKGSLTYYLSIPYLVRKAPVIEPASNVMYYSSCGDGNKRFGDALIYETSQSEGQILSETKAFFIKNGFQIEDQYSENNVSGIVLKRDSQIVQISCSRLEHNKIRTEVFLGWRERE